MGGPSEGDDRYRTAVDGDSSSSHVPMADPAMNHPSPRTTTSSPFAATESQGGWDFRPPRMELPLFSGENPDGWVFRVERYFLLNRLLEAHMLEAAIIGLEGDALTWFQWEHQRCPITSWSALKHLLLLRFREVPVGSTTEELLSVRQESTVKACRLKWEALASRVVGVPEHILEGSFIKGLKEEVKGPLHVLQPTGLAHIIETTQRIEEGHYLLGLGLHQKGGNSRSTPSPIAIPRYTPMPSSSRSSTSFFQGPSGQSTGSVGNTAGKPISTAGQRRLTEAEYQDKKNKGICFKCDKKFHRGHVCEQKTLQVLLMADDSEESETQETHSLSPDASVDAVSEEQLAMLSLNSLVGISSAHTMKLSGTIANQSVTILIDSGATHNFISKEFVEASQIPITATTAYGVLLGTGGRVRTEGICANVELELGSL
ncbi:uncharacterized protein LOC133777970 isoform X1 [Humulus lupulus]|uniref:uncharacterized protein LOC133777970 isoform X1 n=1 Tax=Humulus lupulus TaxID=3486 RepID=UPI002B418307|nr:uncharacterized protein LOC133777970 isoform X1 [Humulus lupulus]XP_062073721.1 uncharacterized protein LOC133777970 isoform X1 [Humulus lupulus]XP_062073722.1 uncharacterized protein LOC133777970 isoform X1 [Humulus lupulus]XP_062073723.1 uncharacterized protein LOC133777970 isoform X1 [Humulus lupulus]XP_062073724.1 uncharacterized protein LOC133777970 isoform X1 [Humulus lupulus]XP_062073725.1 uncharacterized protein LOC133777970 isoform X1 [Humulus lupulus]XP_062073726.1 uncharacterize